MRYVRAHRQRTSPTWSPLSGRQRNSAGARPKRTYAGFVPPNERIKQRRITVGNISDDKWLSRQELANRYGLPVKTLAQWASKGTGPRYARLGRHVRYRLSDIIDWEANRVHEPRDTTRHGAPAPCALQQIADPDSRDANINSVRDAR